MAGTVGYQPCGCTDAIKVDILCGYNSKMSCSRYQHHNKTPLKTVTTRGASNKHQGTHTHTEGCIFNLVGSVLDDRRDYKCSGGGDRLW